MDGISVAASVISIATAGIQLSVRLITLSTQISSASERVSAVANDVSLTAGILHQLGELMTQKVTGDGVSIFSQGGLETTRTSAAICERIFQEVEKEFGRASTQLRGCKKVSGGKIKLSKSEKLKWPFLQPSIDLLRADLREAKGTLMLMLQVATLALSKKMADSNASASVEQGHMFRAIVALRQQQDRMKSEDEGANMQLSRGNAVQEFPLNRQASETESNWTMGIDGSPTLTRSSSSYVTLATTLPQTSTPYAIKDGYYLSGKSEAPANENSTSLAKGSAEHPTELFKENFNSSNATLAISPSISKQTDSSTASSSVVDDSSSAEKTRASGRPSDDQVQPSYLPNKGRKPTNPGNENEADSGKLSASANVEVSSGADPELRMFMLKPIVKDYFDKIELSWSVQNPRMHVSAIKNHLKRMETDSLPSVMDMLETLYDHEHSIIDVHQGQGELLSLKRTKTDIQHKDMLFKGVPGLQFVVEPRRIPKTLKMTTHSSVRLPKVSRSRVDSTTREDQPAGLDDRADLQGLLLNEQGFVLGKDGFPIAKLITGILEVAVGRPLNAHMQIVDDFNRVIASCELLPRPLPKITRQGPFAAFTKGVVDSTGLVKDDTGDVVGRVIEGDIEHTTGCTVNNEGRIVDVLSEFQGHAVLSRDDEGWTHIDSPPKAHPFGETVRAHSRLTPHDASVFKEVGPTVHAEKEYAKEIDDFQDMEETFKKKVSDKERRYREHEVELRARRYEFQMLESQRSVLEEETIGMKKRQASMEGRNEWQPKVMKGKNKKALGLQLPFKSPKAPMTDQQRSADDNAPAMPPMLSPRVYQGKEKSEMDIRSGGANQRKDSNSNQGRVGEIFKSFRVSQGGSVDQILPAALKKYNVEANASDFDLCIKYEGTEQVLGREEQPLLLFKKLDKEGRKPQFKLRRRSAVDQPGAEPSKPLETERKSSLAQLRDLSPTRKAYIPPSPTRDSRRRAPAQNESISYLQSYNTDSQSQHNSIEKFPPEPVSRTSIIEDKPGPDSSSWDTPDSWAVRRQSDHSLAKLAAIDTPSLGGVDRPISGHHEHINPSMKAVEADVEAEIDSEHALSSPDTPFDSTHKAQQSDPSRKFSANRFRTDPRDLDLRNAEKLAYAGLGPNLADVEGPQMDLVDTEPYCSVYADDVEAELYEGSEADEYSDDDDDANDDGKGVKYAALMNRGSMKSNLETEKDIVDNLLNKYTTLFDEPKPRASTIQLPGGIL